MLQHSWIKLVFIVFLAQQISKCSADDGSFAKDFGGPVAQANGPEQGGEGGGGGESNSVEETPQLPNIPTQTQSPSKEQPPEHPQIPTQTSSPSKEQSKPPPSRRTIPPKIVAKPLPGHPSALPVVDLFKPISTEGCKIDKMTKKVLAVIALNAKPGPYPYGQPSGPGSYGAQSALGSYGGQQNESGPSVQQIPASSYGTDQKWAKPLKSRVRRDEGSFATGFGGPVAQVSGPADQESGPANQTPGPSDQAAPSDDKTKSELNLESTPLFTFLKEEFTKTPEACLRKCIELPGCNYFVRSIFSINNYLFNVSQEVLDKGIYVDSLNYDSYVVDCGFGERSKCIKLISDQEARKKFDDYLKTYNQKYGDPNSPDFLLPKRYATDEEQETRYISFKDNLQVIQQLNCDTKGDTTQAQYEITEFTDQPYPEFLASSTGAAYPVGADYNKPPVADRGEKRIAKCPKFNWAEQGFVPSPRKQGKCGACYAFSTSDLIASQFQIDRKAKGQPLTLSPQYIIDCMKGPAALGCNGGRPVEVIRNFTKCDAPEGCNLPTEKCYPYKGKKDKCKIEACQKEPKIPLRWASINQLDGPDEKEKIAALLHWGPAVVIIDAGPSWQFYNGKGIMRSTQCSRMQNHAVLLTGYDYTGPVPFYIIKNSWGSSWGDKGFIKLEAGNNTCAVAKSLTFCCTKNCKDLESSVNMADRPNSEGCV